MNRSRSFIEASLTRDSLNRGVEHELSLLLGPVQNQIFPFRGPFYACYFRFSASIPQAYQENVFYITVDTFCSLVFISAVRECGTKTLETPSNSKDLLACVPWCSLDLKPHLLAFSFSPKAPFPSSPSFPSVAVTSCQYY